MGILFVKEEPRVRMPVVCPYCHMDQIVKRGKTDTGKQRYRCQNEKCSQQSFLLDGVCKGRLPEIKRQIVDMSLNGSGIRYIARVLQISTAMVIHELKKKDCPLRRRILPWSHLAPRQGGSEH